MSITGDNLVRVGGYQLEFRSTYVAEGHSGGPLLNNDKKILGIVRTDGRPNSEATRIDTILAQLRLWGFPVALVGCPRGS